jgi:dUTP pyrophosphatase
MVPTGIRMEIPIGFEAQVRPRSGLAAKHGITVLNSPGTIDSDFRGEVKVVLLNTSDEKFIVKKGDRIAQLVFSQVFRAIFKKDEVLTQTDRGQGGFGSTGKM